MATQKLKGLWIPAEILLNEELSDKEKIILAMILYLSEETKTCFVSNKYIANIVNVTADRVSKIISSLKEKEYISVKLKYKTDSKEIEERQITPKLKNINRYSQKCLEGIEINNYLASQRQPYPIGDNDKDIINNIKKGFPKETEINSIISSGGSTPLFTPSECEAKFYIRAKNTKLAEVIEEKIRKTATFISEITNIPHKISLYEPPSENLITNRTLNRLFSHNLKENGIIKINSPANVFSGLSIGAVSKVVPSIHPYISITEKERINYGSKEFLEATQSSFAFEQIKKASLALAFTGMDLMHNNNLLLEIKNEFYKDIEQE